MFQCALYGITYKKFEWNSEKFNRTEKVYKSKQKKAFVYIDDGAASRNTLVIFDQPDRNKQRTCVVTNMTKGDIIDSYDELLTSIGYSLTRTNYVQGFRYQRSGYIVEISKFISKEAVVDSSEEEEKCSENIPSLLYTNYLVKVYTETNDVALGEQLLQKASLDLIDDIKLITPDLSIF